MDIKQCPNGHYYDGKRYTAGCPYCRKPVSEEEICSEDSVTVPMIKTEPADTDTLPVSEVTLRNIKKCKNNHLYDGKRFTECPYCKEGFEAVPVEKPASGEQEYIKSTPYRDAEETITISDSEQFVSLFSSEPVAADEIRSLNGSAEKPEDETEPEPVEEELPEIAGAPEKKDSSKRLKIIIAVLLCVIAILSAVIIFSK